MATKEAIQEKEKSQEQTSKNVNDTRLLNDYFLDALRDIYWAENAIISGLQKMRSAATNEELTEAFEDHEFQTKRHISRLKKIFEMMGEKAEGKKCPAMEGLLKETEETISSTPEGSATRDATLIISAQKIEHYEIATYGGLVQIALTLDKPEIADILEKTLEEEEDTDYALTEIAESYINFEAAAEDDDDNSEE